VNKGVRFQVSEGRGQSTEFGSRNAEVGKRAKSIAHRVEGRRQMTEKSKILQVLKIRLITLEDMGCGSGFQPRLSCESSKLEQ